MDNNEIDVVKIQAEIKHFYRLRALLRGIGWTCIVAAVVVAALGFSYGYYEMGGVSATLFVAGITIFIVKSAITNTKIRNRKVLLQHLNDHPVRTQIDYSKYDNQSWKN